MKYAIRRSQVPSTTTPVGHLLTVRLDTVKAAENYRMSMAAPENWEVVGIETIERVVPMKQITTWVPDDRTD